MTFLRSFIDLSSKGKFSIIRVLNSGTTNSGVSYKIRNSEWTAGVLSDGRIEVDYWCEATQIRSHQLKFNLG